MNPTQHVSVLAGTGGSGKRTVARLLDAARRKPLGAKRVQDLHVTCNGSAFAPEWFLDTSALSPAEAVSGRSRSLAV